MRTLILLFVSLFSFSITNAQTLLSISDTIYKQHPNLFKSVIEIKAFEKSGASYLGTGFLLKTNSGPSRIFFVTNKHLIGDWTPNKPIEYYTKIELLLYQIDNRIHQIEIPILNAENKPLNNIKIHPNLFVDIAIIEITTDLLNIKDSLSIEPSNINQLIPSRDYSKYHLSKGSFSFLLGYPLGGVLNKKNYPISSPASIEDLSGTGAFEFNISASEEAKATINGNLFKITGPSYHGMSGGMVVIISGHYPEIENNSYGIIGIASMFDDNHNGAYAYKSDKIIEVLNLFK